MQQGNFCSHRESDGTWGIRSIVQIDQMDKDMMTQACLEYHLGWNAHSTRHTITTVIPVMASTDFIQGVADAELELEHEGDEDPGFELVAWVAGANSAQKKSEVPTLDFAKAFIACFPQQLDADTIRKFTEQFRIGWRYVDDYYARTMHFLAQNRMSKIGDEGNVRRLFESHLTCVLFGDEIGEGYLELAQEFVEIVKQPEGTTKDSAQFDLSLREILGFFRVRAGFNPQLRLRVLDVEQELFELFIPVSAYTQGASNSQFVPDPNWSIVEDFEEHVLEPFDRCCLSAVIPEPARLEKGMLTIRLRLEPMNELGEVTGNMGGWSARSERYPSK